MFKVSPYIVSKPNEWTASVAQAARAIDDADLSEARVMQREYWAALNAVLDAAGGPVSGNRKPQPQSWMSFPVGRSHFGLNAVMTRQKRRIRAELYIERVELRDIWLSESTSFTPWLARPENIAILRRGDDAKTFFSLLNNQKAEIEKELDYPLEWEELPDARGCRIACYLNDVDPADKVDWPRQHDWLAKRLNEIHRVFASRVRDLEM
jgi:hypothetical protein